MEAASTVVDTMNEKYINLHREYENHFWSTKMNLAGNDRDALSSSKKALDAFLSDPANLRVVEEAEASLAGSSDPDELGVAKVLGVMKRTFACYQMKEAEAAKIKDLITEKEQVLLGERKDMKLGYVDPKTNSFEEGSSVQIRNVMRVNADEATRKACYEGLLTIGPVVAEKLGEIVRLRNKMARLLGYEDFYDMNVTMVEGFNKATLFEKLEGLKDAIKTVLPKARAALREEKSSEPYDPLAPWNTSFAMSGSVEQALDPYFPFENAVESWGRSFSNLGIKYRGGELNLDLLDRKGKYSNGFCHWPVPAFRRGDGTWTPAIANFTSLASPNAIGSGRVALKTLLHEGGHAAHFANVDPVVNCGSPMFSQERAPTSVAYAENQSMFLDKLMGEGDWQAKYAKDRNGVTIPWGLIEQQIRATHPYQVFAIAAMLMVPFFEKALYEMKDEDLVEDKILALAAKIEEEVVGGRHSLPVIAVPHILSGESCCYYHGYVLADMSVYQTRNYFFEKYGYITDNKSIGPDLLEHYWKPGNSVTFLQLVKNLTGKELSHDSWIQEISKSTEDKVSEEKAKYDKCTASLESGESEDPVELDMKLRIVHGDEVIADSDVDGGFQAANQRFKTYVQTHFPSPKI